MKFITPLDKFKDQSEYLVALLASIVGLAAFRQDLSGWHINLFGWNASFFALATVLVIALLISVYLSAWAILSDNLNITRVPLRGILTVGANIVGTFALGIPIIVPVLWLVSLFLAPIIDHKNTVNLIVGILAGLGVVINGLLAFKISRNRQKITIAEYAADTSHKKLEELLDKALTNADAHKRQIYRKATISQLNQFIVEFNDLDKYIKRYLEIIGYSVGNLSLHNSAKVMARLGRLSEADLKKTRSISALRNEIAHSIVVEEKFTDSNIRKAQKNIYDVGVKVRDAYLDLGNESEHIDSPDM
jgi:hypothetical protein